MSACGILLEEIDRALNKLKLPQYAIFVDFSAAFDTGSRTLCLERFAEAGIGPRMLESILQENRITIDDGVALHPGLRQTTGLLRAMTSAPMFFAPRERHPRPDLLEAQHGENDPICVRFSRHHL